MSTAYLTLIWSSRSCKKKISGKEKNISICRWHPSEKLEMLVKNSKNYWENLLKWPDTIWIYKCFSNPLEMEIEFSHYHNIKKGKCLKKGWKILYSSPRSTTVLLSVVSVAQGQLWSWSRRSSWHVVRSCLMLHHNA